MDSVKTVTRVKGSFCHWFIFLTIWLCSFRDLVAVEMTPEVNYIFSFSELATPPTSGLFQPIEISPAVIPHHPFPSDSLPPLYPTFPPTYDPVLTGRCPVNFSSLSDIMDKTASDCSQPLAAFVGNVICCPQFISLLRIIRGYYGTTSGKLVLPNATADDCFSDIISILESRRGNSSIPTICSLKPSNLTGSCPVNDITTFEKTVNTSKLLEACSSVDPLKECCRPICQPVLMEAALQISAGQAMISDNKNKVGGPSRMDALSDCKEVVYSWVSSKLPVEAANTVFRLLFACKVNKVCPLNFEHPDEVTKACRNATALSPSCCSSLNSYIAWIQKQMLITNRQAILCATLFGSILQKSGVMTNIYELCDVDLKDFSLQAYGQEGCLLRSSPADVAYDNISGFSFTCDLNDNIAAPWPSSSSMTSLSLCAPEMSLPALLTSETLGSFGYRTGGVKFLLPVFSFFVFCTLLR